MARFALGGPVLHDRLPGYVYGAIVRPSDRSPTCCRALGGLRCRANFPRAGGSTHVVRESSATTDPTARPASAHCSPAPTLPTSNGVAQSGKSYSRGPVTDGSGSPDHRRHESEAAALEFARNDPYARDGVFKRVEVKPVRSVCPNSGRGSEWLARLSELKNVELGRDVSAPYAGQLRADMGAELSNRAAGAGDRTRGARPFPGGTRHLEKVVSSFISTPQGGVTLTLASRSFELPNGSPDARRVGFTRSHLPTWNRSGSASARLRARNPAW